MNLDTETLRHLAERGWRPTLEPNQLMKMHDGYVAILEQVGSEQTPPKQRNGEPGGAPRYKWYVWSTRPEPVKLGNEPRAIRAACQSDAAVMALHAANGRYVLAG